MNEYNYDAKINIFEHVVWKSVTNFIKQQILNIPGNFQKSKIMYDCAYRNKTSIYYCKDTDKK